MMTYVFSEMIEAFCIALLYKAMQSTQDEKLLECFQQNSNMVYFIKITMAFPLRIDNRGQEWQQKNS